MKMISTLILASTAVLLSQAAGSAEEERIAVRSGAQDFQVAIKADKDAFKVNDPITFTVRGNEDFFLYVFAVDDRTNQTTLILPGRHQEQNKYRAGVTHRVPNPSAEFFSDTPGKQRLVILASPRYLQWSTEGYVESGSFLTTSNARFESQLESISVRGGAQDAGPADNSVLVQDLVVDVKADLHSGMILSLGANTNLLLLPNSQTAAPAEPVPSRSQDNPPQGDRPIVFLSSDRGSYQAGDQAYFVFGADRPGYVQLYVKEPRGDKRPLGMQAVDGVSVYRFAAQTSKPTGTHTLIAEFTENGHLAAGAESNTEALTLVDQSAFATATLKFKVSR